MKKALAILAACLSLNVPAQAAGEITTGAGTENNSVVAVNNETMEANAQFDFVKYSKYLANSNLNRCVYGIAALTQDTGRFSQPGFLQAADYAQFTNNGEINIRFSEVLKDYASQLDTADDNSKKYDNIMAWGVFSGKNSAIINNGDVNIYYDTPNPNATYGLYSHAIYAHDNSEVVNNGNVKISGKGNLGAHVHGVTTESAYMSLVNNGLISLEVERVFTARAMASSGGIYGSLINNGDIFIRTQGPAFGMVSVSGNDFVNSGNISSISEGRLSALNLGIQKPIIPGAYGMVISPMDEGSDGTALNTGTLIAKIEGNELSYAETVAAGMLVMNARNASPLVTLENTGKIIVSSNIAASEKNQNLVRASEISINSITPNKPNTHVAIGSWATDLRDFGKTKDFIQARDCSIDFSNAKFILRAGELDKFYNISPETLIMPIGSKSLSKSNVTVTGFEKVSFVAEDPEYVAEVKKNSNGSYRVALKRKNA